MAASARSLTIAGALPSLTESLETAGKSIPPIETIQPPEDGFSLLDAKNEIFLSYLQTLALRNLDLIRDVRHIIANGDTDSSKPNQALRDELVDNLIRHRVYLEKGVRPLEDRLRYTIDKSLRAATGAERSAVQKPATKDTGRVMSKSNGSGSASGPNSEDESSDDDSSSGEEDKSGAANAGAMSSRISAPAANNFQSRTAAQDKSGVYRPPRVTATSMPENFDRQSRRKERPDRSRTMDEYVASELADGPMAQPSIGSMIAEGGRRQISTKQREVEQERRDYEETHLMRLPSQGKKEKNKHRGKDAGFGGEDWRGLGEGLDRIDSLTRGVKRKDKESALDKSRKRRATEDGQRQDGTQGGLFDRRKKRMMKKLR